MNLLNAHQTQAAKLTNGESQQTNLAPLTICACIWLKPLLFADWLNLRVVLLNTAYMYNQQQLRLEPCPDANINKIIVA
jgi:hypothetical protein